MKNNEKIIMKNEDFWHNEKTLKQIEKERLCYKSKILYSTFTQLK